jgi:hypothetical protein
MIIRLLGSLILVTALGTLAIFATHRQYRRQHSPPQPAPTDTNLLAAVKGVGNTVNGLKSEWHGLATNQAIVLPDARLVMLSNEQQDAVQEEDAIKTQHELLSFDTVDINVLRKERENELEQQSNHVKQEELQKQIDDIKNKKTAEENAKKEEYAAKLEKENQQKSEQQLLQSKKRRAIEILPFFDYAVGRLYKMLDGFATGAAENRHSDFLGATPTMYASDMVKGGIIVSGTNLLGIGTNSAWNFEISTLLIHQEEENKYHRVMDASISLKIVSRTTNGESLLTITPRAGKFEQISVKLTVPNGLNINENKAKRFFTNSIDNALRHLIEAQDQQCPLILRTN